MIGCGAVCGVRVRVRAYATASVRRTLAAWLALFACDDEIDFPSPHAAPPTYRRQSKPGFKQYEDSTPIVGVRRCRCRGAAKSNRKASEHNAVPNQSCVRCRLYYFLSSFFSSLLLQTRGHWHGVLPYCIPRQRWVEHSYLASPRGLDSAFGVSCTHVR